MAQNFIKELISVSLKHISLIFVWYIMGGGCWNDFKPKNYLYIYKQACIPKIRSLDPFSVEYYSNHYTTYGKIPPPPPRGEGKILNLKAICIYINRLGYPKSGL